MKTERLVAQVLVSREIGKVEASTHMDGNRVNQDLEWSEQLFCCLVVRIRNRRPLRHE
jgi:hypothetical protein